LLLVAAASMAACGGSTSGASGTGSLSGTVDGVSFTVASGIAEIGPESSNGTCTTGSDGGEDCTSSSSGQIVAAIVTNRPGITCSTLSGQDGRFANLQALELAVGVSTGTVTPGTYDILTAGSTSMNGAEAMLLTTTSTCGSGLSLTATSGTVTISALTATSVSGSFSVTFGTEGTFSGSFDDPICEIPDGGDTSSGDGGACQQ
jgi:hypothetical protein